MSNPVTKEKIKKAKADIEKAGGKILSEITLGMHGFVVSLPSDLVQSLDNKDYIDFVEEDQIGKLFYSLFFFLTNICLIFYIIAHALM